MFCVKLEKGRLVTRICRVRVTRGRATPPFQRVVSVSLLLDAKEYRQATQNIKSTFTRFASFLLSYNRNKEKERKEQRGGRRFLHSHVRARPAEEKKKRKKKRNKTRTRAERRANNGTNVNFALAPPSSFPGCGEKWESPKEDFPRDIRSPS